MPSPTPPRTRLRDRLPTPLRTRPLSALRPRLRDRARTRLRTRPLAPTLAPTLAPVLASLRERWTAFLGVFLAVTAGVALLTTTLVLHDSARPRVQPRHAATAALVLPPRAADPDGSPADRIPWSAAEAAALAERLRTVPGVAAAVADRSFYAQAFRGDRPVADDGAAEAGHGWSAARLAPYRLVTGRAPAADDEIVVDRALGVPAGAPLTVNLAAGRTPFTVVGTVDGPGYYVTDAFAARQQPGVQALALVAEPGASAADIAARARTALTTALTTARTTALATGPAPAAALPAPTVVTGEGRAALQPRHIEHRRFLGTQLIGAMALLGLFTTVFVVAAMLTLATGMRRREIGLLRTLGADPRQIRRMILGEAAAVGVLGSLAGCPAGLAAAPLLRNILDGLEVTPPGLRLTVNAWPLLTAAATGIGVSVLGAWSAARLAARVEALLDSRSTDTTTSRARRVGGLAVLGVGVALAVRTATAAADDRVTTALLATMAFIAAAALLAPVLVGPAGRALTAPFRRSASAGPLLVRAELAAHPRRAAALAAPVIAAVGFAVLLSGTVETMRVAYPAGAARTVRGQWIVTPDGTSGNTDEVVAAHPVGKAALPTRAFVTGTGGTPTVLDVLGTRDDRWNKPGEAVLGERTAAALGLTAGRHTTVRFADGTPVRLRVARVLPDDPARGDFVVARALVRAHDPAALTDDVFVPADARPTTLVPGTALHDAFRYALDDYDTDARLTESLAAMLIVIAVGYSGLAVANSMAMTAHARRRDLALMTSAGGTARQLLLASAAETALVVALGAALGILVTLPPLAAMASGLSQATSTPVALHLDATTLTTAVTATLLLALTTSTTVTWRTLRRPPA